MKKYIFLPILLTLVLTVRISVNAQNIGINNPNPHPSSVLDLTGTDKGLLVPRVALTATNVQAPVSAPATSLMVFNTATAGAGAFKVAPGYYYWDGAAWKRLLDGRGDVPNIRSVAGSTLAIASAGFVVMPEMSMSFVAEDTAALILFNACGANVNTCGQRSLNFSVRVNGIVVANTQTSIEDVTNFNTNKIWDVAVSFPVQITPGTNTTVDVLWALQNAACGTLSNGPGSVGSPFGSYRTLTVIESGGSGTFSATAPPQPVSTAWGINGNGGTNNGINFIGTTDNSGLSFRVNNEHSGLIDHQKHNTLFGFRAGNIGMSGNFNVMMGDSAGTLAATGSLNTLIGYRSGKSLSSGIRNTVLGADAARQMNGSDNTVIGAGSAFSLTSGSSNTIIGSGTIGSLTTVGNSNVIIGKGAPLNPNLIGNFNVVIGETAGSSNAALTQNNTIIGRAARTEAAAGTLTSTDVTILGANALAQDAPQLGLSKITLIGANSKTTSSSNATAIGANAFAGGSNTLVLGSINGINGATATVNVGIGTTVPSRRLHIVNTGSSGATAHPNAGLVIESDNSTYAHLLAPDASETGILFSRPAAGTLASVIFNKATTPDGLTFETLNATRMVISSGGNVGIGIINPTEKLMVLGNVDATGDLYTGNSNGIINCGGGNMNTNINMISDAAVTPLNANGDEDLYIQGALELGGNGFKPGGGSWATASDSRLKKDVVPYTDGLQQVLQIKPVKFKYNDHFKSFDNGKEYVGVIAQEIREVAPYTVELKQFGEERSEDENGIEQIVKQGEEFYAYDSSALTYMLINAVKEQQARIQLLESKIEELIKNR